MGLLLLGGAVLAAIACVAAGAVGARGMHAPGNPRRAVWIAVALALPLLLPLAGAFLAVPDAGGDPLLAATAALRIRALAGASGLVLALPVGLSSCLWAGIAAGRRVHQAGERARLSASAVGQAELGRQLASRLERSSLPALGAGIGLVAALFPIGAPSLALVASGVRGLEDLALAGALGGGGAALLGALQAEAGARILRTGAHLGAAGAAVVALLVGVVLHAGSSRRRNLAVALRTVGGAAPARASVESALAASGRPGPLGPAALALLLLVLSVATWIQVERLRRSGPAAEAIAAANNPQGGVDGFLAADRSAGTMPPDARAHLP